MGNRWIIVATDYLTRYAETKALPSGTAVEVAKFFIESIVLRHGAPEVLITDRGSSFMAQLTQEILRLSHTEHRRTTAYHPQTNGLTERLNKTIADMVSMYVDVEHKTWDEVLPYVTFAYNTAVQETTGVTPFQLVYGRAVTTMLDSMLPHESVNDGSDDAQATRISANANAAQLCTIFKTLGGTATDPFVVTYEKIGPETMVVEPGFGSMTVLYVDEEEKCLIVQHTGKTPDKSSVAFGSVAVTLGTGRAEHAGLVFGKQGDKAPVRRTSFLILSGVGDGEKRGGG
ncbi:DDE-type integrase/transposase/recombinase [Ixodes scapularis]